MRNPCAVLLEPRHSECTGGRVFVLFTLAVEVRITKLPSEDPAACQARIFTSHVTDNPLFPASDKEGRTMPGQAAVSGHTGVWLLALASSPSPGVRGTFSENRQPFPSIFVPKPKPAAQKDDGSHQRPHNGLMMAI